MNVCKTPGCGSEDLGRDKNREGGFSAYCKGCRTKAARARMLRRTPESLAESRARNRPVKLAYERAHRARKKALGDVWRAKNREKVRGYWTKWNGTPAHREAMLQRKYGISMEEYERWFARAAGYCEACNDEPGGKDPRGKRSRLFLDHCHKTHVPRGVLCHYCNSALGLLRDEEERIGKLLRYIQMTKGRGKP